MSRQVLERGAPKWNAHLSYALSFVYSMLFGLLVPVLPMIAFQMGASQLELGVIGGASPLTYVPLALLSGRLSDRIGRKRLIVVSSVTFSLACLLYAVSSTPLHLMGVRLIEGVSFSLLWPALEALLVDSANVSGDKLVSNFGVLWSSGSVMGGVLASLVLATKQYSSIFIPSAALGLMTCVASLTMISEQRVGRSSHDGIKSGEKASPRKMMATWALAGLYSFCQGTVFALYPPYAELRGLAGGLTGLAISSILAGRTLTFYLYRFIRATPKTLALAGSLSAAIFLLLFSISTQPLLVLSAGFAFGVGLGLCYCVSIKGALEASSSSRGMYAGLFEGSIGLGYLIGPAIGGVAAEFVLEGPYVISSMVALSVSVLLVRGFNEKR